RQPRRLRRDVAPGDEGHPHAAAAAVPRLGGGRLVVPDREGARGSPLGLTLFLVEHVCNLPREEGAPVTSPRGKRDRAVGFWRRAMAKEKVQPTPESPGLVLERWVASNRRGLSLGLLVAAALFAVIPIAQAIVHFQSPPANFPVGAWGTVMALLSLFGGLYLTFEQPTAGMPAAPGQEGHYRLLALGLGGMAGLATFLLGVWLPLGPWSSFFVPAAEKGATAEPILKVWRENWWRIGLCGLSVVGGLAIMFVSLQLARSVERVSAGMRRLLYGYNAALTGLLL